MTLDEITYNIRNIARQGGIVDDERITNEQVAAWINYYRAILIRRDIDKGRTISSNILQDLGCVPLEVVDASECCDIENSAGCAVLKTTVAIPRPLEFGSKDAITYVGTTTRRKNFEKSSPTAIEWNKWSKYTAKVTKWFMIDNYIYIVNNTFIDTIKIIGVWEDPTEAARFRHCDGRPCFAGDQEYPISAWMVQPITELILSKELNFTLNANGDGDNNASGLQTEGKKQ